MTNVIYRLLGIEPGQDVLRWDRLFFVQPWPVMLGAALAVGALVWVVWFYMKDGTRPSWFWKAPMTVLRLACFVILAVLIAQPMLRSQRVETTPSLVAVVIDETKSMAIKDRWQNAARKADLIKAVGDPKIGNATRAEALARLVNREDSAALKSLLKKHTIRVYRFGGDVTSAELKTAKEPKPKSAADGPLTETLPLLPPKPIADQTRLGDALDTVLQDTAGQPLAGIILLSDGGQNMGGDPSLSGQRAGEAKAPVYTVGFGDPTPPRDLAVMSLLADEVVRKGDQVVVTVSVRHRGFGGRTVPLTLTMDGRPVARQTVIFGKEGEKQEFNLAFTPDTVGARTLTVTLPDQPGEITLANNHKSWPIRIIDKKLKILHIEGQPRWEFRYLKNAILRDKSTLYSAILVDADPTLGGEGNVPIYGFPRDKKALFDYDIVIVGDVPRDFFTAVDMKNLRAFVEERGGSLITMAGENFLPWQYRNSDLEAVWPVLVPATRREVLYREPFQLALTEAGARNPMLFFEPNVERNRQVWNRLPGMYWCGIVERAKPGATVLAEHPSQSGPDGKVPLMAVQQVGEGTSFMLMVDSTWQWRAKVGDKYFYQFWGQVIRSLTPHELPGANRFIRLTADRATYALGEKVVLRARLLTQNFHPVRAPEINAEMRRQDGQRFPVRLEPVPGAAGVFSGEWLPPVAGSFQGTLQAPGGNRGESITNVVVEAASLEMDQPEQNEGLLRRLATMTGGKYLLPSQFKTLPALIPDRHTETETRVEHELWDAPLPLVLFIAFLVLEWILRKRKGLL